MSVFDFHAFFSLHSASLFLLLSSLSSSFVDSLYTESSSANFYKEFILFFIIYSFAGIITSVLSYYCLKDFDNTKT